MEQQTPGPRCIAYTDEGSVCGRPATIIDIHRGGMVCETHDPARQAQAPKERTREEIEYLKGEWEADPCWDIEETEGFELHREELLAFRLQEETECRAKLEAEVQAKLKEMGLEDNRRLGEWLLDLVARIDRLEQRIETVDERAERMVDWTRDQIQRDVASIRSAFRDHRDYSGHH